MDETTNKEKLQGIIDSLEANKTNLDSLKQSIIGLPDNRDAYIEELETLVNKLTQQIDSATTNANEILDKGDV